MNDAPIYKVGLVLLRQARTPEPQVLLVRPKPKNPGDATPWVLPRGSREYKDALGMRHDVRDEKTARKHRDQMEPLAETLLREAEEEAGVPPDLLRHANLRELGVRYYRSSPTSAARQIHWYVLAIDENQVKKLNGNPPDATQSPLWVTLEKMKTLSESGEARGGYIPVIEEAIKLVA